MSFMKQSSGFVINTDDSYLKSLKANRENKVRVQELEQTVDHLMTELSEIKNLLQKVING